MANWVREIDLKEEWEKAENRTIRPSELSKIVSEKLKQISYPKENFQERLEEIIQNFEAFFEEQNDDWDDFDDVMVELYNFGDMTYQKGKNWFDDSKTLWVRTF